MSSFITFNPAYVLKPDEGRALMMSALVGRNRLNELDDSFTNVIHPIYAMILSCIDGREYNECVNDAATELDINADLVETFVNKLIDNPSSIHLKSNNTVSSFPPRTIITIPFRSISRRYNPSLFSYSKVDMRMKRHLTPSTITLMLNNVCATNCIYCYQDKRKIANCSIPLSRILDLIHEARRINVNTFDVIGGEFFLYKHWKEVLSELRKYNYNPYISTKLPLTEDDIKFLSDIKILDLQVSIDSLIEDHLITSLKVSEGYASQMRHSLELLAKYKIPIMAHTVLTRYNDSIEDMQSIYDVLKGMPNIIDWHIVKSEPSLYPKADYSCIEINPTSFNCIVDYLTKLKNISNFTIHAPNSIPSYTTPAESDTPDTPIETTNFFNRSFCSGLFSSLYILPDGQVTICEQLYWNKDFIVGNILRNSLIEIWNSDKAKRIYFIKQSDIPTDSLCHSCDQYDQCRSVRQVCYREIIRKYGAEKWYYPDINCPYTQAKERFDL